ncbi:MAG: 3-phosphoshikimate 1-carboxyvinyltransferase, 3-phosphoshikimate 1-carboxyvinyltransferase [candidate division NC10 bacterium CSP1-5]|nr:MAG: 3-phosphoshikimate 1-carboxyvinyltransferase, 3-phosphoshikimate 1-carboxyvinyltransferase [candidate division NC10 bacterium CSP1-5]
MEQLTIRGGARGPQGSMTVPGDKSISHRAIILGALAEGVTEVSGCLRSEDCQRTLGAFRALGVEAEGWEGDILRIYGKGLRGLREAADTLNCGNSGTTIRLLAGVLAGQPFLSLLTGDASLRRRPMDRIIHPLTQMGAEIWGRARDTLPPLAVRGGSLHGVTYRCPVPSAQVKSAILLAGLFAEGPTTVIEPAASRDHTERMLTAYGQRVERSEQEVTLIPAGTLQATPISVPGDFSSAAFLLVAGLILPDSDLTIEGVGVNPTRTGLLDVLQAMGAKVQVFPVDAETGEPRAHLRVRASRLQGVSIGGDLIPRLIDEIPVLAVAAACAEGKTVIRDAAELRVKESDRIRTIAAELSRMGVRTEELPDGLIIHGGRRLQGARCEGHGDHRVAMALTVAGLQAEGQTIVRDTACIRTSFPGFVETLEHLFPNVLERRG